MAINYMKLATVACLWAIVSWEVNSNYKNDPVLMFWASWIKDLLFLILITGMFVIWRNSNLRQLAAIQAQKDRSVDIFYKFFNQPLIGMALSSRTDGLITMANEKLCSFLGYTRQELEGLPISKIMSGDSFRRIDYELDKDDGSADESVHGVILGFVDKFGNQRQCRVGITPANEFGTNSHIYIIDDYQQIYEKEKQLMESENRYRQLFNANPSPMWVYDLETHKFLAVNDAALDAYGYTEDEFRSMTVFDIRPEPDREKLRQHFINHENRHFRRSGQWRHCKKDGSVIDVDIISHTLVFDGRPARAVLAEDVTKKRTTRTC